MSCGVISLENLLKVKYFVKNSERRKIFVKGAEIYGWKVQLDIRTETSSWLALSCRDIAKPSSAFAHHAEF